MTADNTERTFVITGATGAIGQAISRRIASDLNNRSVLLTRDREKSEKLLTAIIQETGNRNTTYQLIDLSRKNSVFEWAEGINHPVDVLINNAATAPRRRKETPEGIELQFATNILGYFWMSQALFPILRKGQDSRIVNVASYWAGNLDLGDVEFIRRRYDNGTAYRQSKQANRMLTVAFADRFKDYGITVNACHPGDVNSTLSNDLGFSGHQSAMQGANTPVLLATTPLGRDHSGEYFVNGKIAHDQHAHDRTQIDELFRICSTY